MSIFQSRGREIERFEKSVVVPLDCFGVAGVWFQEMTRAEAGVDMGCAGGMVAEEVFVVLGQVGGWGN